MTEKTNEYVDEETVVNQDEWLPSVTDVQANRVVIDLNKPKFLTYTINKNFRQGENMATLDFFIKDGTKPHHMSLDTAGASIYAIDASDKVKILNEQPTDDWLDGRITFHMPGAFFTAAGKYKRFMAVITQGDQVLTSPNLDINVGPNGFYSLTASDVDFYGPLYDLIQDLNKKVNDQLSLITGNVDNALTAYNNINNLLKTLQAQIDALDIVHAIDFNNLVSRVDVLENSFGHGYVSDIQLINKSGLYDGDAKTLNIPAQMPTAFGILANFKDEDNGWVQIMGSNWYKQKSLGTWLGWANDSVYSKVVPSPINGFAPDYTKDDCLYLERHGNTVTFFFIGNIPAGTINDAKVMMPIPEFFRPNSQVIMRATPNGSITAGSCLLQAQGDSLTLLGNDNDDFQYVIYQNWEV